MRRLIAAVVAPLILLGLYGCAKPADSEPAPSVNTTADDQAAEETLVVEEETVTPEESSDLENASADTPETTETAEAVPTEPQPEAIARPSLLMQLLIEPLGQVMDANMSALQDGMSAVQGASSALQRSPAPEQEPAADASPDAGESDASDDESAPNAGE